MIPPIAAVTSLKVVLTTSKLVEVAESIYIPSSEAETFLNYDTYT